jgi:hypothetical protein
MISGNRVEEMMARLSAAKLPLECAKTDLRMYHSIYACGFAAGTVR